jgi:hypothetical protein
MNAELVESLLDSLDEERVRFHNKEWKFAKRKDIIDFDELMTRRVSCEVATD